MTDLFDATVIQPCSASESGYPVLVRDREEFSVYVAMLPALARDDDKHYPVFLEGMMGTKVHDTLSAFDVIDDGLHPDTFIYDGDDVLEIKAVGLYLVRIQAVYDTYTDWESGYKETELHFAILQVEGPL